MAPARIIDGRYEIVRLLGEGGMGAVFEARHTGTRRRVAVKVITGEGLAQNASVVARFQREAQASGSIETQHIAHVLDTGKDAATGHPYLVMELLDGRDVQQTIEQVGPLPPDLALRILAQACIGLGKAHEAGIVHRDIKPANLFVARQDNGGALVKLLDFGIAKVKMEQLSSSEGTALTRTGAMLGSPLYMSPEQAKGAKNIDHRTDLWSLGVVLYEALSGTTPYAHADTLGALIFAIGSERPRPVQDIAPWVPPEVAAIVHRALLHDRSARFQTAHEMFKACQALLQDGYALSDSMFTPLTPEVRAISAPRISISDTGEVTGSEPRMLISTSGAVSAPGASTDAGVSQNTLGERRRSRTLIGAMIGATALVVGIASVAAYRVALSQRAAAATAAAVPAPQPPQAPAPAPAAAPTFVEAPSPASPERWVSLAVSPANVAVEVDGHAASVEGGAVAITGSLGSMHEVRLWSGKRETKGQVVIAEGGAVPAKIELGVAPAPPPARPKTAAPAPQSAGQAGPAAKPAPAQAAPVDREWR